MISLSLGQIYSKYKNVNNTILPAAREKPFYVPKVAFDNAALKTIQEATFVV